MTTENPPTSDRAAPTATEQPASDSPNTTAAAGWSEARRAFEEGLVDGCSCHLNPPCTFCTEMTEDEANAQWNGGMDELRALWREQDEAAEGAA